MKISLVCPTNRKSISSYARVCELLSLDPNKFEVIIRDNSECEKKRRFLESLSFENHQILIVPNNGAAENFSEASKLATLKQFHNFNHNLYHTEVTDHSTMFKVV